MGELRGKRILVTGGTGFVGSHLVQKLVELGAYTVVLERSHDPFSYFSSQQLSHHIVIANGDLKDEQRIYDVVSKYGIEIIFHLGAQPIVTTAYENPIETIQTNIMGTVYLLEATRKFSHVQGIIVASSDKAYGKMEGQSYTEETPLQGDHPYDVSKSSADLIAHSYFVTYGIPVVTTRFGNIYGEGDTNFSRIVPGIMKSLVLKEKLVLRSNGEFIREYLYVKDVVSGYINLAEHISNVKGQAFNFGSNYIMSVKKIIAEVEAIIGEKIFYTIQDIAKNEIPAQHLNWEKAKRVLNWSPQYSLQTTIQKMYAWYEFYFHKANSSFSTPENYLEKNNLPHRRESASGVLFSS